MKDLPKRAAGLVAGIWAGVLLCVGFNAAPAAFAVLPAVDAGRYVGRLFALDAYASIAFAVVLYVLVRGLARRAAQQGRGSVVSMEVLCVLGALFCTIAGYFALQPMIEAARSGQGSYSFAALHGASMVFFALRTLLVVVLALRLTR